MAQLGWIELFTLIGRQVARAAVKPGRFIQGDLESYSAVPILKSYPPMLLCNDLGCRYKIWKYERLAHFSVSFRN